jgi:hypothetical protein
MAKGLKTGGRQKGTPNRRTLEVADKLAALDCDPIEGMARIAMDTANPPQLRARMYAELAGYVAPKRKAVEYTAGHEADGEREEADPYADVVDHDDNQAAAVEVCEGTRRVARLSADDGLLGGAPFGP